uniref:Uncharacterized protein n=1 Tax=Favella ehrenbergii TaxID=182087 RepID=A0A7S3MLA9_9SPIT|mmetsp:Transcript_19095/g.23631  ORF Transcript_19095/g.23631 Transcript_19095/m.23631 type:complete len:137 (+) Transcript_19095:848-1258(+)|eukprot:CAMPEP_0170458860 /NCGR_PEP_ID=MMETSP0123-20130129/5704_1 /TAXON_ID=182087 /ORGANISM="Favella ehrenbergii, Strain Fehren 1" /LENGTH=136 /DNA_ID=CAMNT_0010723179 /DNA_START=1260 /DNA_END=1670 /DNA_ORIENTATION=-
MDTGDMNQNSQKRLATNDNKNKLLKLRLAEPFPAHDSDELEEPVSDSNKSPIMLQQPDAGKILFSPKFGGGQLESQNSVRNRDAHVEEFKSGQKTPAFTGVIGNLLTGNPKRPAKRVPKEHSQPPVHQSSGVFRFF